MAKKSAKSKGFRKQNGKKPYLSKRDIALLCVLVAAVVVGAIFLFRYDDGALKVQDGKVVAEGDNWLIVNGSNTRGGRRYYKLGEVGELEGYTREAQPSLTDANVTEHVFTAQDEAAAVDTVTISASHATAQALSAYAADTMRALQGAEVTDVRQEEVGGKTVRIFGYAVAPVEADAAEDEAAAEPAEETDEEAAEPAEETDEEAAETEEAAEPAEEVAETEEAATEEAAEASPAYSRAICAYFDVDHDSSVMVRLQGGGDSADACPTDEQLTAALAEAIGAVNLEAKGK